MNQELVDIREEVVMTYIRYHDDICLDELRKIMKGNRIVSALAGIRTENVHV
jgi:hypothetical protein